MPLSHHQLSKSATITDVVNTLRDPEEYVRQVLGNMTKVKKNHGGAVVRIGTTGHGAYPHYRIDPSADEAKIFEAMEKSFAGERDDYSAYFIEFHGRSHEELPWGIGELKGDHWSNGHMTWKEVQELLGELRGHKRR